MRFAPNFSFLICRDVSAPAALASLLFDLPEPQNIGKTQRFATFLPFRAPASLLFLLSHLLTCFIAVRFPCVHTVGRSKKLKILQPVPVLLFDPGMFRREEPVSQLPGQMLGSGLPNPSPDYSASTGLSGFPSVRDRSLSPGLKLQSPDATISSPKPSYGSFGYGAGSLSPRSMTGMGQDGTTEVQRRAAEWERQIEHLDAKELEIHQTQLRLIREQTAAFRSDFAALRKELQEMKASVQRQQASTQEQNARWDELITKEKQDNETRISSLERDTQRLRDDTQLLKRELRGQDISSLLQTHDADLKSLKDAHSDLKSMQSAKDQHHASLQQRVDYLEKIMGDSADKHAAHMKKLEELQSHSDDHKGRHAEMAEHVTRLKQEKESLSKRHASFEERMRFLEQSLGDSADRHQKELKAHKDTHSQQHAGLEERMKYLEKVLGDSAEEHAKLLAKQKKDLEDHKQSFMNHQRDFDDHRTQLKSQQAMVERHATLEQRLDFLEQTIGDSAQHHMKQLQAHKADLDQKHQAHSSLADRVEYMEKWFSGLPGFSPPERLSLPRSPFVPEMPRSPPKLSFGQFPESSFK
eukprot:s1038_g8.t1